MSLRSFVRIFRARTIAATMFTTHAGVAEAKDTRSNILRAAESVVVCVVYYSGG